MITIQQPHVNNYKQIIGIALVNFEVKHYLLASTVVGLVDG